MAFLGKLLGGTLGFLVGGPIGALVGVGGGHMVDRFRDGERRVLEGDPESLAETQIVFSVGLIALSAKVAKADGRVTPEEIRTFRQVFRFPERDEAQVAGIYNEARRSADGYEDYARQLASILGAGDERCAEILDCLYMIATADGELHPNEDRVIRDIGRIFGFGDADVASIRARHAGPAGGGGGVADAASHYQVLGVAPDASVDEIRSAHRALVRKFHPDHLVSKGLPDELLQHATERLAAINSAYDAVMKSRGRP